MRRRLARAGTTLNPIRTMPPVGLRGQAVSSHVVNLSRREAGAPKTLAWVDFAQLNDDMPLALHFIVARYPALQPREGTFKGSSQSSAYEAPSYDRPGHAGRLPDPRAHRGRPLCGRALGAI